MTTPRRAGLSISVLVLLATLLSGCAGPGSLIRTGPGSEFQPQEIESFTTQQGKVLEKLYVLAGISSAPTDAAGWDRVIQAGMGYADQRCNAYIDALTRLNRNRKTAVAQIGLVGAATAGVMAAVEATAKEVAIIAILFGLAASTVDNLSSNVLYELEPSAVQTLVQALQVKYRETVGSGYVTRPAAMAAIRNYAILCTPARIETEVNLAVKKAQPEATTPEPGKGQPPVVTNAPIVAISVPGTVRTQLALSDRIDRLRDQISKLKGAPALALSSILPLRNTPSFVALARQADPRGLRFTDETVAVKFAQMWLGLSTKSEQAVADWEKALAQLN